MDIEDIKKYAKNGDVNAQVELAQAYLTGNGVAKNRKHYMTWLIKAAENGHLPSMRELIGILSDKRNKYSNPEKALHWMRMAQKQGATFTQEELVKVGDPGACSALVMQYLFDEYMHNFNKAKGILLKFSPEKNVILAWAKKYHSLYADVKKEQTNIAYLYMKACNGDADELNNIAVELITENEMSNAQIAFFLFREASNLNCDHATASYFYCLTSGKGTRKNLELAVEIYNQAKAKGVDFSQRFATQTKKGKPISIPASAEWKKLSAKYRTKAAFSKGKEKTGGFFSGILSFITDIPSNYWETQAQISTHEEAEAISKAIASGESDGDGCRDEGCTEFFIKAEYYVFLFFFLIAGIAATIYGTTTGHIPDYICYTLLVTLLFPSVHITYGLDKIVTTAFSVLSIVALVVAISYYLVAVPNWADFFDGSAFELFKRLLGVAGIIAGVVIVIGGMSYIIPMGIWWHYLLGIEDAKGTLPALLYVVLSMSLIIGGGYLLYTNGIVF